MFFKKLVKSTAVIFMAFAVFSGILSGCNTAVKKPEYVSLMEFRKIHEPHFIVKAKAPQPYDNTIPPGALNVIFQSEKKDLRGWLFLPRAEGKRPAILYAHSGYALDKYDAEAIRPFVNAGYVVFVPAWRGENGNPGTFEMCYGEVVDAVNALNWLSNRPEVDATEIYGAGNGVGATIIWLLAELSPKMNKAACFGPFASMMRAKDTYSEAPFNKIPDELKVRSPGEFMPDLKCPLLLIYASGNTEDEPRYTQAKDIYEEVKEKVEQPVQIVELAGADHRKKAVVATSRMISFFATK